MLFCFGPRSSLLLPFVVPGTVATLWLLARAWRRGSAADALLPVRMAERRADGTLTERGRLEPGQRARLAFAAGSAALVRNLGKRDAELDAVISGDASAGGMGMTYEVLRK